ncbi:MAG: hypothetical protein JO165_10800 [Candidatus Eremiobacteraeota bacterium]|nr:hypothetical protein [Candidatus Eremiobacteraeota bacterium]
MEVVLTSGFDWAIVLDVGVGLGIFLGIGIGGLWIASSLAQTLRRLDRTLDVVDEQVASLGVPVRDTLTHVGGIAGTADETVARLTGVVSSLEDVAGSVAHTAKLAQNAVSPALVNVGAAIGGVTAGLRRLVRGDGSVNGSVDER